MASLRSRLTAAGRRRAIRGRLGALPEGGYAPPERPVPSDAESLPDSTPATGRIPRQAAGSDGAPGSAAATAATREPTEH